MTRRQLLAVTAAAAIAAAGGGAAVAWQWWDRPPDHDYTWLSAEEVAFVESYADALFPPGGEPALAGADAGLGRWFDHVLSGLPPGKARQLKLLLHALDNLARTDSGSAYTTLSRDVRWRLTRSWMMSPVAELRGAVIGLGALLGGGYTTHPETAAYFSGWHGCGYGR